MTIEINYKRIMGLIMFSAVLVMLMVVVLTSGCMTYGGKAFKYVDDLTGTPYPTPTPTIAVTTVPTPEIRVPVVQKTESPEELMLRTNGRWQNELLTFGRSDVDGKKDLLMSTTVYGYKIQKEYHYWSVSWADYFTETPQNGYKFLFVYVVMWVDDVIGDDVRPYGMDQDHFYIEYKNKIYHPVKNYDPVYRVKEMETVYNYNDDAGITPYGYLIIVDETGTRAIPGAYIKGGKSNAWDGYIIYEVPQDAQPEDLKVIGRFEDLAGWHWWQLK